MKKHYGILIALIVFIAIGANAQGPVTVRIDNVQAVAGTDVHIPVYADFSDAPGSGAGAFDFTISFNATVLPEFIGIDNLTAPLTMDNITMSPTGPSTGTIAISWFDLANPTQLDDKLFDLVFHYAGSVSNISFIDPNTPGVTEVGDEFAEPIPGIFINGRITEEEPDAEPVPIASWSIILGLGLIVIFVGLKAGRVI